MVELCQINVISCNADEYGSGKVISYDPHLESFWRMCLCIYKEKRGSYIILGSFDNKPLENLHVTFY